MRVLASVPAPCEQLWITSVHVQVQVIDDRNGPGVARVVEHRVALGQLSVELGDLSVPIQPRFFLLGRVALWTAVRVFRPRSARDRRVSRTRWITPALISARVAPNSALLTGAPAISKTRFCDQVRRGCWTRQRPDHRRAVRSVEIVP